MAGMRQRAAEGLQVGEAVAEGAGLGGAARGVVLGIEEEHQGCTAELVAAALHTLGIRQGDQGGTIAGGEGGSHGEESKLGSPP